MSSTRINSSKIIEISGMSDVGLQEDSGRDSDSEVDGPVPTCLVLHVLKRQQTPLA